MAALGGSAQAPPPKPLDQALEAAVTAPKPEGVTARVRFTNNLFPSGALSGMGGAGSALTSGGSGRLWWSADVGGRIELQSDAGDAQILWDEKRVTVWDSSSNTSYELPLPAHAQSTPDSSQPPTLAEIDAFLKRLAEQANVTDPSPSELGWRARLPRLRFTGPLGGTRVGLPARLGRAARGSARDRNSRAGSVEPRAGLDGHRDLLRPRFALRPGGDPAGRREEGRARGPERQERGNAEFVG